MDFNRWEPIYQRILDDFGYSRAMDKEAAELLVKLRGSDGLRPLKKLEGKVVEIQGPYIETPEQEIQITAGSAVSAALDVEADPTLLVTDLDGDTRLQLELNLAGTPVVMHAHGDNIDLLDRWAPEFEGHVISTCQCEAFPGIHNFGGFTDGDRAVYLADHFGAEKIVLNGWDFERPISCRGDEETKEKKLRWARRLIEWVDTPVSFQT